MKEDKRTPGFSKEVLNQAVKASAWLHAIDNVTGKDYFASGVCVDPSGIILTAGHLFHEVIGNVSLAVYIDNQRLFKLQEVEKSNIVDVAVIKLRDVTGLPSARLRRTELPPRKEGHEILIAGYKFDGNKFGSIVMTGKTAAAKGNCVNDSKYPDMTYSDIYNFSVGNSVDNMIQVRSGISGSPLFTPNGEVIGITKGLTFYVFPNTFKAQGIAIKSTRIKELMSL